jgi:hypothetical protein
MGSRSLAIRSPLAALAQPGHMAVVDRTGGCLGLRRCGRKSG